MQEIKKQEAGIDDDLIKFLASLPPLEEPDEQKDTEGVKDGLQQDLTSSDLSLRETAQEEGEVKSIPEVETRADDSPSKNLAEELIESKADCYQDDEIALE